MAGRSRWAGERVHQGPRPRLEHPLQPELLLLPQRKGQEPRQELRPQETAPHLPSASRRRRWQRPRPVGVSREPLHWEPASRPPPHDLYGGDASVVVLRRPLDSHGAYPRRSSTTGQEFRTHNPWPEWDFHGFTWNIGAQIRGTWGTGSNPAGGGHLVRPPITSRRAPVPDVQVARQPGGGLLPPAPHRGGSRVRLRPRRRRRPAPQCALSRRRAARRCPSPPAAGPRRHAAEVPPGPGRLTPRLAVPGYDGPLGLTREGSGEADRAGRRHQPGGSARRRAPPPAGVRAFRGGSRREAIRPISSDDEWPRPRCGVCCPEPTPGRTARSPRALCAEQGVGSSAAALRLNANGPKYRDLRVLARHQGRSPLRPSVRHLVESRDRK